VPGVPPRVRIEATSSLPLAHPDLFVASTPPALYGSRPDIETSGDRVILTSVLQGDPAHLLQPLHILVTLADDTRSVEAGILSRGLSRWLQAGHCRSAREAMNSARAKARATR
jgi:hypothetical protein